MDFLGRWGSFGRTWLVERERTLIRRQKIAGPDPWDLREWLEWIRDSVVAIMMPLHLLRDYSCRDFSTFSLLQCWHRDDVRISSGFPSRQILTLAASGPQREFTLVEILTPSPYLTYSMPVPLPSASLSLISIMMRSKHTTCVVCVIMLSTLSHPRPSVSHKSQCSSPSLPACLPNSPSMSQAPCQCIQRSPPTFVNQPQCLSVVSICASDVP